MAPKVSNKSEMPKGAYHRRQEPTGSSDNSTLTFAQKHPYIVWIGQEYHSRFASLELAVNRAIYLVQSNPSKFADRVVVTVDGGTDAQCWDYYECLQIDKGY